MDDGLRWWFMWWFRFDDEEANRCELLFTSRGRPSLNQSTLVYRPSIVQFSSARCPALITWALLKNFARIRLVALISSWRLSSCSGSLVEFVKLDTRHSKRPIRSLISVSKLTRFDERCCCSRISSSSPYGWTFSLAKIGWSFLSHVYCALPSDETQAKTIRLSLRSFRCEAIAEFVLVGKFSKRLSACDGRWWPVLCTELSIELCRLWLLYGLPMIGVPCSTYSGSEFAVSRNCSRIMDGEMNVIRGLLLTIWPACCFDNWAVSWSSSSADVLLVLLASWLKEKRI